MPTPSLPKNDPNSEDREQQLIRQQKSYLYDYELLSPLALLQEVPKEESFSPQYIAERSIETAELIPNLLAAKARSFFDPLDELQDYEDFFNLLPLPKVAKVYQTNDSFAEQRLSGANPLVIRRLNESDPRAELLKGIPSSSTEIEPLFNIAKELTAGNIYITDYTGESPEYRGPSLVQGGTHENGRKYLPKPLAFFWWREDGVRNQGKLVPIAIQLKQQTNNEQTQSEKLYTPFAKNSLDWLFAKFCVQIADANHHEMNTHLCRTHFVMEPIAIGTARQLAENHPLSILLRPHFLFMVTNNQLGQQRLINPDGPVDKLLAGTLAESMELVKEAYQQWDINEFSFPKEIKNRNMEEIPHYPYRDDGLLLWNEIKTFVSSYLNHFYPSPQELSEDTELEAWAKELANQETGGKVKGFPSQFNTVEELIEIVSTIIFICGPQHSAVNYAQYEYMAFAANMPLAGYKDIHNLFGVDSTPQGNSPEAVTKSDILEFLPPYKRTADQLQTLFILSAYRYDQFGHYDRAFQELYGESTDEIFHNHENQNILEIIRQFQQNLNIVEQKIDTRNLKRVVPYLYLKPSLVLNSISI